MAAPQPVSSATGPGTPIRAPINLQATLRTYRGPSFNHYGGAAGPSSPSGPLTYGDVAHWVWWVGRQFASPPDLGTPSPTATALTRRLLNRMHKIFRQQPGPRLRGLFYGMGRGLGNLDLGRAEDALYFARATGRDLDEWGRVLGNHVRLPGETDAAFRLRIYRNLVGANGTRQNLLGALSALLGAGNYTLLDSFPQVLRNGTWNWHPEIGLPIQRGNGVWSDPNWGTPTEDVCFALGPHAHECGFVLYVREPAPPNSAIEEVLNLSRAVGPFYRIRRYT